MDKAREMAALNAALEEFAIDMRARLQERVDQGKVGWDDPDCAYDLSRDMFRDAQAAHFNGDRLHLHDIANRAMMLWWQFWRLKQKPGERNWKATDSLCSGCRSSKTCIIGNMQDRRGVARCDMRTTTEVKPSETKESE